MDDRSEQPVLVLGGGINGAAAARELVLSGVPVTLVEARDIACGATSRSSRLIHGGLRYLEYGDFALVRESLRERSRLRRLAPQFVAPLRLSIPVARRGGGWIRSALRFLKAESRPWLAPLIPDRFRSGARGLWLVRLGLRLYDLLARDAEFPKSQTVTHDAAGAAQVDGERYRWQCVYADGQMLYPERFVVALLEDARRLAAERSIEFRVLTYHRAEMSGELARLHSTRDEKAPVEVIRPRLIVNATGAWGDLTLDELGRQSPQLFGGTKGSHLVTHHAGLKSALGDGGVYAEADDGRLVFLLPFGEGVLVGTTDERFEGPPEKAVATPDELDYLIELVGDLFPQVGLSAGDVDLHYAGVRPLPYQPAGRAGSISRGHTLVWNESGPIPLLTLIGGKLTTCRALAEEVMAEIGRRTGCGDIVTSRERVIPGGEDYPTDDAALLEEQQRLAKEHRLDLEAIQAIWSLCGRPAAEMLARIGGSGRECLPGTQLPLSFVRETIEREWVETLDDLVERRLMLLFERGLSVECLRALADCLVSTGRLGAAGAEAAVESCIDRLDTLYGKQVVVTETPAATST